jgi:hypothetical protein
MKLLTPTPEQALGGLRAMKAVAIESGPISPAARALLGAAQRNVLHTDHDLDALAPITPEELAALFAGTPVASQLALAMTILSLSDGVPEARVLDLVRRYARALGVDSAEVDVVSKLAHQQTILFKLDFLRRSHIKGMLEEQYRQGGFAGLVSQLATFRGKHEDHDLARRYRDLGTLPEGTVGYRFFRHYVDHGFSFPGEKYGFPEAGVYHDFSHVLGGYGTSSEEEMLVAAFIAGFRKQNPTFVLLFVMLTFGAGYNVTPINPQMTTGILAAEGLADRFLRALDRGSKVRADLSENWDHWAWVGKPLDEARRELGVEAEAA